MAATYTNWMQEIKASRSKTELENVMQRYSDSVGFAANLNHGYQHNKMLAEQLKMFGVAQRFAEAAHKVRFLE